MTTVELTNDEIAAIGSPNSFGFGPAMFMRLALDSAVSVSEASEAISASGLASVPLANKYFDYVVFGCRPEGLKRTFGLYLRMPHQGASDRFTISVPRSQYQPHIGGSFSHRAPPALQPSALAFLSGIIGLMEDVSRSLELRGIWLKDEGAKDPGIDWATCNNLCVFGWVVEFLSLDGFEPCGCYHCRISAE